MDRSSKDDYYSMDTIPRGLCLLINNVNFKINLAARTGSEIDAAKIAKLFQDFLLFQVQLENDVTISKLRRILSDLQHKDHSRYSAFALVFLSHGDKGGVVYCSDGTKITIKEISSHFSATCCPSLYGKPKLFFIQACRGQQSNQVIQLLHPQPRSDESACISHFASPAPDIADFLFSFATIEDFTAMRHLQGGSWYINELVRIIRERARTEDLSSILTMVTNSVSKYQHGSQMQVPEHVLQLRKKLYFFPRSDLMLQSAIIPQNSVDSPLTFFVPSIPPQVKFIEQSISENDILAVGDQRCGLIIVIDNIHEQTDQALEEIKQSFGKHLGFHVQVYSKLLSTGLHHLLSVVANSDHTNHNCIAVIIFSKGKKGKYVYDTNGEKIKINEIINHFDCTSCKSLSKFLLLETTTKETDSTSKSLIEKSEVQISSIDYMLKYAVIYPGTRPEVTFIQQLARSILSSDCSITLQECIAITEQKLEPQSDICEDMSHIPGHRQRINFLSEKEKGVQRGEELIMALILWVKMRKRTIEDLKTKRDKIIQVCKDARRTRVAGAVTSLIGGGLTVVGLGLIPVTLGGSLALSVVGAGIGVAGGVTSVSATFANAVISKTNLKHTQAIIEVDQQLSQQINKLGMELKDIAQTIHEENPSEKIEDIVTSFLQGAKVLNMSLAAAKGAVATSQFARIGGPIAIRAMTILAARVTGAAAKVSVAGGVVSLLIVPLDIYEIASNVYKLCKKSESSATKWLNEQIEQLQCQMNDIEQEMKFNESEDITTDDQ